METYSQSLVVQLILALMEATGQDEIRVSEDALVRNDPREHLLTYRDDIRFERVYRRIVEPDVIDGEEVAVPLAIEGATA
jgi:hypothetical protein